MVGGGTVRVLLDAEDGCGGHYRKHNPNKSILIYYYFKYSLSPSLHCRMDLFINGPNGGIEEKKSTD